MIMPKNPIGECKLCRQRAPIGQRKGSKGICRACAVKERVAEWLKDNDHRERKRAIDRAYYERHK